MGTELAKQTERRLTFQRQPTEFLDKLATYLKTIQLVYRTQLAEAEMMIWRETLKDYSFQEFERAMSHLIANPPKYEIDGETQVWRGMPKLPDVVDVMLNLREQDAREADRWEALKREAEQAELKKRRDEHPEEFFGWADVLKAARERGIALTPDRDGNPAPGKTMTPAKGKA